jgi:hypothetical protein
MAQPTLGTSGVRSLGESVVATDAHTSGVSWGAVIAGAFGTAALSLMLLALGTGIGLSSVSPWANTGASAAAVGWSAIIWIVVMQVISSAVGGYLAGRLRTRWRNVHTHEVFFRDTAHGFLAWAVALVITAAFLTTAATSIVGGAVQGGASAVTQAAESPNGYWVDRMLRANSPRADGGPTERTEIGSVLASALKDGAMAPDDRSYVAKVIAARTGLTEAEAQSRVDETYARAQRAADTARKAIAHSMYWAFLALLVGAFSASYTATIGGKLRDGVPVV